MRQTLDWRKWNSAWAMMVVGGFGMLIWLGAVGWAGTTTEPVESVQAGEGMHLVPVGLGVASNGVNTAVFRKQSVVTHGDTQFVAYYDGTGHVVLGKRKLGEEKFELRTTELTGSMKDAHNVVNIGVDGEGVLHVVWDHHNSPLNYRRGKEPGSLELVEATMTGQNERKVTYPEFNELAGGDLLFLYRDGASGNGNLVLNRYDVKAGAWRQLFANLVDGEKKRNAYWQACTDARGTIHLSWVWRESPDVSSNHDVMYARSTDGGVTWTKSTGERYALPITMATAEVAAAVPAKHELINQTSMTADGEGRPYIATYWRPEGTEVPQYFVVYNDGSGWKTRQVAEMTTAFRLGGKGSKRLPMSRPQILSFERGGVVGAYVVFRAESRGDRASLATCNDLAKGVWTVRDLTLSSLGEWEPTYDLARWRRDGVLDLFVERVEQVDLEGVGTLGPQMVYIGEVVSGQ